MRDLCDGWQFLPAAELETAGPALLKRLRREWSQTRAALAAYASRDDGSLSAHSQGHQS